jgi:predicted AlkP superfamily pyrophosphatase or phosphodiesterase
MRYGSLLFAALVLPAVALSVSSRLASSQVAATLPSAGHATVFWVSVDGFRHDYVEMDHPAFLTKMMHEGAYSTHMRTIFPSLTFPSHVAEETGVPVDHHGVPANDYYDRVTKKTWVFPPDGSMLNAEPIWNTATRQGVRTDVFDWPLSQMEKGPDAAAYFNSEAFNGRLNPAERMDEVLDPYEKDHGEEPVRLLMGYMEPVDHAGHSFGPEAPQTADAVRRADAALQQAFDRAYKDFEAKRKSPDDVFYFLMTTDHGMTTVKTLVRLDFILGLTGEGGSGRRSTSTAPATAPTTAAASTQPGWVGGASARHSDVTIVTSGPLGNVYLPKTLSTEERETRISEYLARLKAKPYLRAYRQEEVPAEWHYRNADRIGDIVVILDEPYTFSGRIPAQEYPVGKGGGPLGMHGYSVENNPDMEGFTVMWRSKGNWGGKDLGIVHSTQFHATVAEWLGIKPAKGSGPAIEGVE